MVKRVTETDNLTVAGRPVQHYVTEYTYRNPLYEGRQREFRGFGEAEAKRIGDANSPTDITRSVFLLGECKDELLADAVEACASAERFRDNPREALKGLPIVTEKRDESGRYLSTEHVSYRLRHLYTGLDGRAVRHAFEVKKDTYLYNADGFVPASSSVSLVSVELETDPSASTPAVKVDTTTSVALRSHSGRVRLKSESVVDLFGNKTKAIAHGCLEGCSPKDERITTTTEASRPPGDRTGWLWRTTRSVVTGDQYFLGELRETLTAYNPQGSPVSVTSVLKHTLPLDRFHAGGGATAPSPADASSDGNIVWLSGYDQFGNLVREEGPNGRCRDVAYDSGYQQLPTTEAVYTGGGCTLGALSTTATYDRGFELVVNVTDMQSQPTAIRYDHFGRLSELTRPDPLAAGQLSPLPSLKVQYFLPPDLSQPGSPAFHSIIRTETQDGDSLSANEYLNSYAYIDGFGRTVVTLGEADTAAGDDGKWIASARVTFDKKGAAERKYLEHFFNGSPMAFNFQSATVVPFGTQSYDAFGRQRSTTDLDGTITLFSRYGALSTDKWDAEDINAGPHSGTFASASKDGHGRVTKTVERFKEGNTLRERETLTTYLPTNEPLSIVRRLGGTSQTVARWMRYDSLGRLLLGVEPNTSVGFNASHTTNPTSLKAWRYTYNHAGDLVGTSDARGCGSNFGYDGAGRLLVEDYSPCQTDHAAYSAPNLAGGNGVEVAYLYDAAPASFLGVARPANYQLNSANFLKGRLVATLSRGAADWTAFDGRGRAVQGLRQIKKPGAAHPAMAQRFAPRVYEAKTVFDAADREISNTTGARHADLQGTLDSLSGNTSAVTTFYSRRGTVKSVEGSYGTLVASIDRAADSLINELKYGDAAQTTTGFSYDIRRRVSSVQTYRGPPGSWTSPPSGYQPPPTFSANHQPTFQLLLQDDELVYDDVSNPTEIRDWRIGDEWPEGAKPVTRKFQYDDLYRVKRARYQYEAGGDDWKSPFEAENSGQADLQDPRRAKPSPHVSFDKRVLEQTYSYDWLGNTSASDDDAHGFYDRSLGTISNSGAKPYQLTGADNVAKGGNRTGRLATRYDSAGNLVRLGVDRAGPCLPMGAACNQLFAYSWDEVGRLVRARRWDSSNGVVAGIDNALPNVEPEADLSHDYDSSDDRVLKTARDKSGAERYTAYVFSSLELRRAPWIAADGDYELTQWTEVAYLFAAGVRLARLAYEQPDVPSVDAQHLHVFFELGDHLGSTSVVLDKATSELVEKSTYEAYGSTESDYRPERWKGFREDYKFTSGKEHRH